MATQSIGTLGLPALLALSLAGCSGGSDGRGIDNIGNVQGAAGHGNAAQTAKDDTAGKSGKKTDDGATFERKDPVVDHPGDAALRAEFGSLERFYRRAPITEPYQTRAPSGSATFNGVTAFAGTGGFDRQTGKPMGNVAMVADTAVTLDFDKHKAHGSMWSFHDAKGHIAGGSVQLSGSQYSTEAWIEGSGMLDWKDRKEKLHLKLKGQTLADYDALRAQVTGTSTSGLKVTPIEGLAVLENDQSQYRGYH